jgi:chromosome segregation ATPase
MPCAPKAAPPANLRRWCILACLGALALGAGQASAWSPDRLERSPSVVLAQASGAGGQARPAKEQGDEQAASTELKDLNEVLAATQAKLQELFEATAALAEGREAFEAMKQENERLAAALQEANAARSELERASKRAEARIAELTKTVDEAARDSGQIDEQLADLRRENADLADRLALADKARAAAASELERSRNDTQEKLEAATGTTEQVRGELAQLREQLARAGQELARAQTAREQALARVSDLERSSGEAEGVRAELAAVKEQLRQAATAAIEAERNRQTASAEAEQLQGELERARQEVATAKTEAERGRQTASADAERLRGELEQVRQEVAAARSEAERRRQTAGADAERLRAELVRTRRELTAATAEVERFSTANAELEQKVASLEADSQSAMEAARRNLVVMEQRIEQLNAALAGAGLAGNTGSASRRDAAVAGRSPAATGGPAEEADAGPDAEDASELAAVRPAPAGARDASAELAKFNENIAYLNRRAMDAAGSDLFAGIEAAGEGVVQVSTTPAWEKIPAAGQRSYLDSLLDLWIVAQEGSGPAVVRIVDPNGRVLLEKSGAVQNLPPD